MRYVVVLLFGVCVVSSAARAADGYAVSPRCEPIPLPEQPGPARCVMKPDKKEIKKTVYEVKWVPYCLPKAHCAACGGDCHKPCPECEKCVRWKRVIVKRDVVVDELCCYKCVAEECYPKAKPEDDAVPPAPKPAKAGTAKVPPVPPAPPAAPR